MGKTRLELAVKLREEADIAGTGPTSTLNQTGEYKMLIGWLDDAYERIQSEHVNWEFLWAAYTFDVSSGTASYTPTAASITDHGSWIVDDVRCYLTATGYSDEQEIYYVRWDDFKRTYLFGSQREETGRPIHFTVKPDDSMVFYPIPDDTYTIVGERYKAPVEFSADADEPVFPDKFHNILVWGALFFYGANYVEPDRYTHGENQYKKMKALMEIEQLPGPEWGPTLA